MANLQKTTKKLIKAGVKPERAVLLVAKSFGLNMYQTELLYFSIKPN